MKPNTFKTTVGDDIEVTVTYDYEKACPGSRDRWGLQMEPDSPASVTILDSSVELTSEDTRRIEEEILEDINARAEPDPDYEREDRDDRKDWERV